MGVAFWMQEGTFYWKSYRRVCHLRERCLRTRWSRCFSRRCRRSPSIAAGVRWRTRDLSCARFRETESRESAQWEHKLARPQPAATLPLTPALDSVRTRFVLERHADEVWFVAFSHSGKLLASAAKDNFVVIWGVIHPSGAPPLKLSGHSDTPSYLAWAPDDDHLLSCGAHLPRTA